MDTHVQMHTRVKLLEGDADVDHTQTIGGDILPGTDITPVRKLWPATTHGRLKPSSRFHVSMGA